MKLMQFEGLSPMHEAIW